MNTYLVPTTAEFGKEFVNIMVIYADSQKQAYETARNCRGFAPFSIQDYKERQYETFYEELPLSEKYFSISRKNDILKKIFALKGEKYMEIIELYNYMHWGDYNAQIQSLADKALPEKWSFEGKNDNAILKNYLRYTFNKLQSEEKVIETDTYCVFNTGLFSHYYVPIYVYGELNKSTADNAVKWYFKGFKDEYELGRLDLDTKAPERADYFSDPQRLIFNWHNKVIVNNKHILDDLNTNIRLPESIKNSKRPLEDLTGVVNTAIQKVIANYKLAIPHYYQDKIQLLIPLCFDNDTPSVALVLDLLKNGDYLATTCLTMEMAYMDARIIAKPESNWLMAENIIPTEKVIEEK